MLIRPDGKKLLEEAMRELKIEGADIKAWHDIKYSRNLRGIVRDNAMSEVRNTVKLEKMKKINEYKDLLFFAFNMLEGKIKHSNIWHSETRDAVAEYAFEFSMERKHFIVAAEIGRWYLGAEKEREAIDAGIKWYVEKGNPKSLNTLSKKFGIEIGDADMNAAVLNLYERTMYKGHPDIAANGVEKHWRGAENEKEEMIRTAVGIAIDACIGEDELYTALSIARKYRRYGFENEATKLSNLLDRMENPNGEHWEEFRKEFNRKGKDRILSNFLSANATKIEEGDGEDIAQEAKGMDRYLPPLNTESLKKLEKH